LTFVWLAVALAFGVAEVLSVAFYAVFFVIGGLAAAIAALLGVSQVGQVIVFCVVSIAGVLAARPPLMGYLNRTRPPETRSGAQAMIGQEVPVIEEIQAHQPGHVRVAGESWPAISADGSTISAGSVVHVDSLRQATLVVSLVRGPVPDPAMAPGATGSAATAETPPASAETTTEG